MARYQGRNGRSKTMTSGRYRRRVTAARVSAQERIIQRRCSAKRPCMAARQPKRVTAIQSTARLPKPAEAIGPA
jgi:hypothetical protein